MATPDHTRLDDNAEASVPYRRPAHLGRHGHSRCPRRSALLPGSALLPIWWLVFVLYAVASNAAAVVSRAHGVELTPAWVAVVVAPVSIASSVLSVLVVQTLTKIQKARSQDPAPADQRVDFAGRSRRL
jgi:hypothetical protein